MGGETEGKNERKIMRKRGDDEKGWGGKKIRERERTK